MSHDPTGLLPASVTFGPRPSDPEQPRFVIDRPAGEKNNYLTDTQIISDPYTITWAHSTAGQKQLQNASLTVEFDNSGAFKFGKIENGSFEKFPNKTGSEVITTANLSDFNILASGASELTYRVMIQANLLNDLYKDMKEDGIMTREFSSYIKTIELTELTQWHELLVHGGTGTGGSPDGITLRFNTSKGATTETTKYCRVYLRQVNLVNNGDLENPVWELEKKTIPPENFSGADYNIEKLPHTTGIDRSDAVHLFETDGNVVGTPEGSAEPSALQLGAARIMYQFDKTHLFERNNHYLAKYKVTLNTAANKYLGLNNEQLSATITLRNYYEN